jgi:lipoprotein-anchoring transpeptidase ErfK/SrfK
VARSDTKLKARRSPKRSGGCLYWFLAVGVFVIVVWIWWYSTHPLPNLSLENRPQTNALPSQPLTLSNALTQVTNQTISTSIPRQPQNLFELQLVLARRGISSGSLDGATGEKTRSAIRCFQQISGLPITGQFDRGTQAKLVLDREPFTNYVVSAPDLSRLLELRSGWLAKSQQPRLDYETILELVSERFCAHPNLIRRLNPGVDWSRVPPGSQLIVPNIERLIATNRAAYVRISLSERWLEAVDENTNIVAHFPCSIAQRVEKRPVGHLKVVSLAPNPNYLFDPRNFPESIEAKEIGRKLMIPSGPNNPVGTAWIGLSVPGYGIHGTPRPEEVGRAESHGCFRLSNWNAEYLIQMVGPGTPVYVTP